MNPIRLAILTSLILTELVITLAAYPVLPDQVISHGNTAGVPDGSMGKLAGIGLVPLIMVALVALLLFLPRIDPLRKNYAAFRDWFDGFIPAFVPGGRGSLHNHAEEIPGGTLFRRKSKTVEAGLFSQPVELDGIKIRIVGLLPYAENVGQKIFRAGRLGFTGLFFVTPQTRAR